MNHKGKRLFITGMPTSGKSYLANAVAQKVGAIVVSFDDVREELAKNEKYKKWTNFYLEQDEEKYFKNTSEADLWNNLVLQSEGLWPAFLEEISKYRDESKPVIFECVNLLPHLIRGAFDYPCIVLIGSTFEETLSRNIKDPRWGNTIELQTLEAKNFFYIERPHYIEEAKKFNYQYFESSREAFQVCVDLLETKLN